MPDGGGGAGESCCEAQRRLSGASLPGNLMTFGRARRCLRRWTPVAGCLVQLGALRGTAVRLHLYLRPRCGAISSGPGWKTRVGQPIPLSRPLGAREEAGLFPTLGPTDRAIRRCAPSRFTAGSQVVSVAGFEVRSYVVTGRDSKRASRRHTAPTMRARLLARAQAAGLWPP